MKRLLLNLIKIYRAIISPILPSNCRFHPTCSEYGYSAIEAFGVTKGSALLVKRILRCHPFNTGGYDPIPRKMDILDLHNDNA